MDVQIKKRHFFLGRLSGVVAFLLLLAIPSVLWAETRSLKIYYIHTREKAEIVYKKDGRYIDSGLKKLNHLLRDWRRNEPTNMDPRLFDLIWQVYRLSGSRDYIHVVSAYRSPSTNNMLRSRSSNSGVAKNSQHTLGKALDFYLPDVNLAKLRGLGLKQEGGGVGYYPTSGSPFIHMDVGSVRHWPRMNRKELMALFPDGKTIHVPSDGKPLDGYNQAMAAYNARKGTLPPIVVAKEEKTKSKSEKKSLFASLFGNKKSQDKKLAPPSQQTLVASAPPQSQPVLPEENAPIPVFSPLKQGREVDEEPREDGIAALLIAETELDDAPEVSQRGAPEMVSEMGFVPIPALKTQKHLPVLAQGEEPSIPLQIAQIPPLSRPILPPMQEDNKISDNAQKEDIDTVKINDERRDLAYLKQEASALDMPSLDRDMIRAIITQAMEVAEADIQMEADTQMVASVTPRTTPKADKPSLDALGALIAQDEAQRLIETSNSAEEIRQIPELVFVSGLQKGKKQPIVATLDGKAINFPPVVRVANND